jgi:hypothetical protein
MNWSCATWSSTATRGRTGARAALQGGAPPGEPRTWPQAQTCPKLPCVPRFGEAVLAKMVDWTDALLRSPGSVGAVSGARPLPQRPARVAQQLAPGASGT